MGSVITGRIKRHMESKTRSASKRKSAVKAVSARFKKVNPSMILKLRQDTGKLPAGILIEFPQDFAELLIRRRLATVVGDLQVKPDLVLEYSDLDHAGLPLDLYQPS